MSYNQVCFQRDVSYLLYMAICIFLIYVNQNVLSVLFDVIKKDSLGFPNIAVVMYFWGN